MSSTATTTAPAMSAWAPFGQRAFTLLWTATLISNIGTWMNDVGAGWLMTQLAQILDQRGGAVMAGYLTQGFFVIGVGAFHDQQVQIRVGVEHFPEPVRVARIAGERERFAPRRLHPKAYRGLGMRDRDDVELTPFQRDLLSGGDHVVLDDRVCRVRKFGEIRPDLPIKHMFTEHAQRFILQMDSNRLIHQDIEHRVHQKRDKGDVIQMSVGEEYVPYPAQLLPREITCPGTTVDQYVIVDQQRCGSKTGSDATATAQDSYLHGNLLST